MGRMSRGIWVVVARKVKKLERWNNTAKGEKTDMLPEYFFNLPCLYSEPRLSFYLGLVNCVFGALCL